MTLDETLAAIEAVESKATKGPWMRGFEHESKGVVVSARPSDHPATIDRAPCICTVRKAGAIYCPPSTCAESDANLDFIPHSRNILPPLLRLVRRQAEEIAEHRACDNGSGAEASYSISWERLLAATDLATAELVKAWEEGK